MPRTSEAVRRRAGTVVRFLFHLTVTAAIVLATAYAFAVLP